MKLVCPGCGAVASAESFINDANARQTLLALSRLPGPLPGVTLAYMSLFRPGRRALTWKKALRLAGEIDQLVSRGYVRVKGKIDRDCPPAIWAAAMEQMVEYRDGLDLPMPNHNYLRKVAHKLAQEAARANETPGRQRKNRGTGQVRQQQAMNPFDEYIQGLRDTKPSDREIDEWKKRRMSDAANQSRLRKNQHSL